MEKLYAAAYRQRNDFLGMRGITTRRLCVYKHTGIEPDRFFVTDIWSLSDILATLRSTAVEVAATGFKRKTRYY